MYHAIVERRLRAIFAEIGRGNAEPMLRALGPDFVYRFEGDTALGGERRTVAAMRLWWERLYRVFPGLHFEIRDVLVKGWPWDTRVATYLRFKARLANGQPYENDVVQMLRMRWGRVTRVHTIEDSLRCARTLADIAAGGQPEAVAPPITDPVG
jgi:ketosteroid isomerase-like protein